MELRCMLTVFFPLHTSALTNIFRRLKINTCSPNGFSLVREVTFASPGINTQGD